jgi:hypothetical protein
LSWYHQVVCIPAESFWSHDGDCNISVRSFKGRAVMKRRGLLWMIAVLYSVSICAETVTWGSARALPFDSPLASLSQASLTVGQLIYDPLLSVDESGQIVGALAQQWYFVDDTHLRLTLRQDVRFHSGNRLTAADVIWSYHQHLKTSDFAAYFAPILSIDALSVTTLEIVTDQPRASLPKRLASFFVYDSKWQQMHALPPVEREILASGTGPFKLMAHFNGIRSELKRNLNDWRERAQGIEDVVVIPIHDPVARLYALHHFDIDIADELPIEAVGVNSRSPGLIFYQIPRARWVGVQFNRSHPLLSQLNVRRAIGLSLDGRDPEQQANQLLQAHQLIEATPIAKTIPVNVVVPQGDTRLEQLVVDLKNRLLALGLDVSFLVLEDQVYDKALSLCQGDLFLIEPHALGLELPVILGISLTGHESVQTLRCHDGVTPLLQLRLDQIEASVTAADYRTQLAAMQRTIDDGSFVIPLTWLPLVWGESERLKGMDVYKLLGIRGFEP